jgi:CopG family nickel-responsive transcriptional regulator
MSVARFGVSLENELLEALDGYVRENMFPNRSQAIRQLIEKNLVEKKWKCNNIVAGAITLTYQFHRKELIDKITEIKILNSEIILSSQLFYISQDKLLEIIAVKGPSYQLTELSDKLIGLKGIDHGKLIMSKVD